VQSKNSLNFRPRYSLRALMCGVILASGMLWLNLRPRVIDMSYLIVNDNATFAFEEYGWPFVCFRRPVGDVPEIFGGIINFPKEYHVLSLLGNLFTGVLVASSVLLISHSISKRSV